MEPLYWLPHREWKTNFARVQFMKRRAQCIADYYREKRAEKYEPLLMLPSGAKSQQPPVLELVETMNALFRIGQHVAVTFGHRQQVEIIATMQERVCVRLPGGHGVKWFDNADVTLLNPAELKAVA